MHASTNRWSGPRKLLIALAIVAAGNTSTAHATINVYTATLSGANEVPANGSAGTGNTIVTLDDVANTMRVEVPSFSGLSSPVTAAHIHAPAPAGANVGVAVGLTGFPTGVTSGSYDVTFDMTLVPTYNTTYLNQNGGTATSAWLALRSAIAAGNAYLNIHTVGLPGGEIRGQLAFFVPVELSSFEVE